MDDNDYDDSALGAGPGKERGRILVWVRAQKVSRLGARMRAAQKSERFQQIHVDAPSCFNALFVLIICDAKHEPPFCFSVLFDSTVATFEVRVACRL